MKVQSLDFLLVFEIEINHLMLLAEMSFMIWTSLSARDYCLQILTVEFKD